MTAIFQRGVKEAIAENERLGIIPDEATIYAPTDEEPVEVPLVSEEEAE